MSIEFESRPPKADPESTTLRRLGAATRNGLALFCETIAALPLPLPTRLLDRLDERLARARRSSPGRGDRYTRSLFEHRTQSTQRDVEWIDELIAAEGRDETLDPSTPAQNTAAKPEGAPAS